MIYYTAALSASFLWAFTAVLSKKPVNYYGGLYFNRLRMLFVCLFLLAVWLLTGMVYTLSPADLFWVILSGFIGICVGDTLLFEALDRIGPRRNAVIFAANAPMTAVLSILIFGEQLSMQSAAGILLVFAGVVLAVIYGTSRKNPHQWDEIKGSVRTALILAFTAALCQALGIIIVKPVMLKSPDPVMTSLIRVAVALTGLNIVYYIRRKSKRTVPHLPGMLFLTAFSGFLGMGVGMTLVIFALQGGHAGIVAALSSVSPVLILPIIAVSTRQLFPAPAWMGAVAVVIGTALIFTA